MGQYDDGFDWEDQNDQQQNSGKALREARDKAASEAKELKKQLDDALAKLTERNLKDVLQGKSLNPGLARFMKADGIDGSDESAVDKWLTDNGELIGFKPNAPEEPAEQSAQAAEFARMQNVQVNALPAGKFTEAMSRLAAADGDNLADVNAALRSAL